jgi:hypothetical protein
VKAWIVLLMALCLPLMVQASEEEEDAEIALG